MAASARELAAFEVLDNRINTWFSQHMVSYDIDDSTPADQRVVSASIELNRIGDVIRALPLEEQITAHLRKKFAYVTPVKIEPEIERITITISKADFPTN